MLEEKDLSFLSWLYNRLLYKHNDKDKIVIDELLSIINKYKKPYEINIDNNSLDLVLSKYYIDFYMEKSSDINIGYSDDEREKIRNQIKNIVSDIVNKQIPKEPLLKG